MSKFCFTVSKLCFSVSKVCSAVALCFAVTVVGHRRMPIASGHLLSVCDLSLSQGYAEKQPQSLVAVDAQPMLINLMKAVN